MSEAASEAVRAAQVYYDSNDADQFYFNIWGGEDIHIGLYESPADSVRVASGRTVARMAQELSDLPAGARVLDVGAGYGGAARYLAKERGLHVTCLNLSETQNRRNRELTQAAGLAQQVEVVQGDFEALPFEARSFDAVWSQDAILHSGNRPKVLREVARVIRSRGHFVFTDPMQADDCPQGVLGPVLARIHLDSLGSFAFYREQLKELGFVELRVVPLTAHLGRHYSRVHDELSRRYDSMVQLASRDYVDRMLTGLGDWTTAQAQGHLAWGILHFRAA